MKLFFSECVNLSLCLQMEPSKGLKKAIEDDQKHKAKLVAKYDAVQRLYEDLPKTYKKDLKQAFKGCTNDFFF